MRRRRFYRLTAAGPEGPRRPAPELEHVLRGLEPRRRHRPCLTCRLALSAVDGLPTQSGRLHDFSALVRARLDAVPSIRCASRTSSTSSRSTSPNDYAELRRVRRAGVRRRRAGARAARRSRPGRRGDRSRRSAAESPPGSSATSRRRRLRAARSRGTIARDVRYAMRLLRPGARLRGRGHRHARPRHRRERRDFQRRARGRPEAAAVPRSVARGRLPQQHAPARRGR